MGTDWTVFGTVDLIRAFEMYPYLLLFPNDSGGKNAVIVGNVNNCQAFELDPVSFVQVIIH